MIIATPRAALSHTLANPTGSGLSSSASTPASAEWPGEISTPWGQQAPTTCGFLSSTGPTLDSAVTCAAGSTCAINTLYSALGCCTQIPCVIPTTCMDSAAVATSCDSLCSSNPYILKCTASGLGNCATLEASWFDVHGSSILCSESSTGGHYYPFSTYESGASTTTAILPEPSAFSLTSNWTTTDTVTSSSGWRMRFIAIPIVFLVLAIIACFCHTRHTSNRHKYYQVDELHARRDGRRARPEEHELQHQERNRNYKKPIHNTHSQSPRVVLGRGRGSPRHESGHPSPRKHEGTAKTLSGPRGRGHAGK